MMRPIPLAQLQGGGGGGGGSLMMILFVCCISSIISAIVGYVFRKQITKALGGAPAAAPAEAPVAAAMGRAPVNAARGRAPAAAARGRAPVKARRLKIKRRRKGGRKFRMKFGKKFGKKIGRRKGVRKIRGKLGRALKKFGRRKGVRKIRRRSGRSLKKLVGSAAKKSPPPAPPPPAPPPPAPKKKSSGPSIFRTAADAYFKYNDFTNPALKSDKRLKSDIVKLGEMRGFPVYSWNWNEIATSIYGLHGGDVGVIAQELPEDMVGKDENDYLFIIPGTWVSDLIKEIKATYVL